MGRLTPEMIEAAAQFLNPVGQYELCLRGKRYPAVILGDASHDRRLFRIENSCD